MPVEMIGWIAPRVSSELIAPSGPPFDPDVIAETARIHERASFDRVLIGYFSDAPDGFLIGAHAASVTKRLGFLLAHRPGFVAPPVAARKLATLDQLSQGRLAVHIITGGATNPGRCASRKRSPLGHRGGVRSDQKPVRRVREVADQHAVEAGALVNARRLGNHLGIERRPGRRDQLRGDPRRDPADHLHRHSSAFLN